MTLDFASVTFCYPSQTAPVFSDLTVQFGRGWTGIVGPNGEGKTTLLQLASSQLTPTAGHVRSPGRVIYCAQRTDTPPEELADLLATPDHIAAELIGRLGILADWPGRWSTLSHGERKRAQIACALWSQPDVLALDEPTNHVDSATRDFLIGALARFRGIGLLVSHDRALLDHLCAACLILEHGAATLRPGNYTQAHAAATRDLESRRHERANAKRELTSLAATAAARRREADQADAKRSKRHLDRHDNDGRAMINLARYTGKDGKAGRLLDQLDGRLKQASARLNNLFVPKDRQLGIELRGEPARRPVLLRTGEQTIPLADTRHLHLPPLEVANNARIGISGPNGCGKSTLLRHLLPQFRLEPDRLVYLPQELDASQSVAALEEVRRLDHARLGGLMSAIACLGSAPDRLLGSELPSPGELRKLLLALGLLRRPHLVIMDEPTNHLDLPSIECLETALAQCTSALILVSHDIAMLEKLTTSRWMISPNPSDDSCSLEQT